MAKISWTTLSELRHEIVNARSVLPVCVEKCKKGNCEYSKKVIKTLKDLNYHFEVIQNKLTNALNEVEENNV